MQRPLGESLRGRARIERFDRDLLRIERRIERKLMAGVGEAKKSKPRSEHQGPHRKASFYDLAVLTSRMVVSVIALAPAEAAAHAFGTRYDLPLPLAFWLAAAGLAVALSFLVFALALRRGAGYPQLFLLRVPPTVVGAMRAVSAGGFFVVIAARLFGIQDACRTLAPP